MSKTLTTSEIRRHRAQNKEWINCFDAYSKDLLESGILARDESWLKESLFQTNAKHFNIYGVNSHEQSFWLDLKTCPKLDETNGKRDIICIEYSYEMIISIDKNRIYKCSENGFIYHNLDNQKEFKFPGLLLEILEPFQRWRIKFNGIVSDENNAKTWISMRWLWLSNTEVFDFRTNCDVNYLTKQTKRIDLTIDDIFEDRYVGCGQLKGVLQIENSSEEQMFLWGSKSKASLLIENKKFFENFDKNILMAYSEKGMAFEIVKVTSKQTNRSLYYGWGTSPHGTVHPIQDISPSHDNGTFLSDQIKLRINGKTMNIDNLSIDQDNMCRMTINGHKAFGFVVDVRKSLNNMSSDEPNEVMIDLFKVKESHELVLPFDDKTASNESLTGGKGSSLSLLKNLSQILENEFIVPNGFVVTTNSYQMLLRENPNLNKEIKRLQTLSWSESRDEVEECCKNLMDMFCSVKMPLLVSAAIKDNLKILDENGNFDDVLVAVRSSACGEDSEDMSAAGQMTTYLGVKGLKQICDSVLKCWSSQFNVIAVEYRRGYGQLIDTPMAVVIQEMIDCDVAGVMFTCDPITGAPNRLTINANYGIGESVVSATVNPDNISVLIDMNSNSYETDRYVKSIINIDIGAKESSIKISKEIGSGTEIKDNVDKNDKCCLDDDHIIKLAAIGLKVQRYYGSIRDIEWGLKDDKYYLFQSRPVTHLNAYNEWELTHEFDSGHLDELEYNTKANLGEVMPGAMSPLSITSTLRVMWSHISENFSNKCGIKYNPLRKAHQAISVHNYAEFFSLKDAGFYDFAPEEHESFENKGLIIATFGHPVDDQQLRIDSFERNGVVNMTTNMKRQKDAISKVLTAKRKLKSVMKKYNAFDFAKGIEFENSKQIFDWISKNLYITAENMAAHIDASLKSVIMNLILLKILSKGNLDVKSNPDLLIDFANVLSTTGQSIVSADAPTAIKSIAKSIENPDEFKKLSPEEGLRWLESKSEETAKLYEQFMENYGYRGSKEYDMMSTTWSDNKNTLVTTIQAMLPIKEKENESILTTDQLIGKIKTPLSKSQKFFLKKWLLPACHSTVALREEAKAFNVKCLHEFRQLFRQMAQIMCYKEGRIPEKDLIYFLTFNELKTLVSLRDPKIVMKAKQRKRIYSKLDKYIYNEISIGPDVKPKNLPDKNALKTKYLNGPNSLLTGTPVCTGSVTAKVCVAKTIEEANTIQPDDILVTYSTDIGWSPYLPMVSGIITEIGGLVSHGAVIAREYGIPCLVGVDNACEVLSSGDTILLDADNSQIVLLRTNDN